MGVTPEEILAVMELVRDEPTFQALKNDKEKRAIAEHAAEQYKEVIRQPVGRWASEHPKEYLINTIKNTAKYPEKVGYAVEIMEERQKADDELREFQAAERRRASQYQKKSSIARKSEDAGSKPAERGRG